MPEGARIERIKNSPHYADGQFQNLVLTPPRAAGSSCVSLWLEYPFIPEERLAPTEPIPTVKTDLMSLNRNKDIVIWLGHYSYYMQFSGKQIPIDPVFSSYAALVSFVNGTFKGNNRHEKRLINLGGFRQPFEFYFG